MARPKSDIQSRIVDAARTRFLADGVDGASLRRIARGAKTSIGMIYYYYPTKDDLFLAVVEGIYVGLLVDMEAALTADAPVRERIRRLFVRIGSLSEVELSVVKLIVREALVSSVRLERLALRFQRGHLPLLLATIRDGFASGAVNPALHPALAFMAMLSLGVTPQVVRRLGVKLPLPGVPEGEDLSNDLVELLFHGISNPNRSDA